MFHFQDALALLVNTLSPLQKPFAAMSSLAPSDVLTVALAMTSPVSGCRSGSTTTSWHTSVMSFAVKGMTLIVAGYGEPSSLAGKGMLYCESDSTFTVHGGS